MYVCVGSCGHWGVGYFILYSYILLFLSDASYVRGRGLGGYKPILCIHVSSGFFVFRSILHNKPSLTLATSLRSYQAEDFQSLEHLSTLTSSVWRLNHPLASDGDCLETQGSASLEASIPWRLLVSPRCRYDCGPCSLQPVGLCLISDQCHVNFPLLAQV